MRRSTWPSLSSDAKPTPVGKPGEDVGFGVVPQDLEAEAFRQVLQHPDDDDLVAELPRTHFPLELRNEAPPGGAHTTDPQADARPHQIATQGVLHPLMVARVDELEKLRERPRDVADMRRLEHRGERAVADHAVLRRVVLPRADRGQRLHVLESPLEIEQPLHFAPPQQQRPDATPHDFQRAHIVLVVWRHLVPDTEEEPDASVMLDGDAEMATERGMSGRESAPTDDRGVFVVADGATQAHRVGPDPGRAHGVVPVVHRRAVRERVVRPGPEFDRLLVLVEKVEVGDLTIGGALRHVGAHLDDVTLRLFRADLG
ncbi:MAG: hypothetical protein IPN47_15575 [Gemmatimonadetes bacterium]|nr:hypothetical protein [Gemmatimonadota bacterium]